MRSDNPMTDDEIERIYNCPCDHPTHTTEEHTQESVGCPDCSHYHDDYYFLTNKQLKTHFISKSAVREALILEPIDVGSALDIGSKTATRNELKGELLTKLNLNEEEK